MKFLGYISTILLAILICWALFGDLRCGVTHEGDVIAVVCRSSLLAQHPEVPHG